MYYPKGSERVVISAQPNWFVAWPWTEGTETGITLDPIVGWLMIHSVGEYDRRVQAGADDKVLHLNCYPITSDGITENYSAIKSPDGQFQIPGVKLCANEADFLAEWKKHEEKLG
jgi:hypothetical protein